MPVRMKKCRKCGNEYPATDEYFHRHSHHPDGLRATCIQCSKLMVNPENTDPSIKKTCTACGESFPATREFFYPYGAGKYGVMAKCIKCEIAKNKLRINQVNTDKTIKRICNKCGNELPATLEYFNREKAGKYGISPVCKECKRKYAAERRMNEDVNMARRIYDKNRRSTEEFREYNREYSKRRLRNPKNKLSNRLSCAIRNSLKTGSKNRVHWEWLVDFTLESLKKHLEKQFLPGMSWDNYGEWHIDHIIPISAFNFSEPCHPDFARCWSLKNLQPMWAKENMKKSNRLEKPFQPQLALRMQ